MAIVCQTHKLWMTNSSLNHKIVILSTFQFYAKESAKSPSEESWKNDNHIIQIGATELDY